MSSTAEEVIDEVQRLERELERPPLRADIAERSGVTVQECLDTFGTWEKMLRAAGVLPSTRKGEDARSTLLAELRLVVDGMEGDVGQEAILDSLPRSERAYRYWFGSVSDALSEIGVGVDDPGADTAEMRADVRRIADHLEKYPTQREVRLYGRFSPHAHRIHFGSFRAAIAESVVE